MTQNLSLGHSGERIAEDFLRKKGYKVLLKNYRSPLGEIDLICLDHLTYVFIEVKTSSSLDFGIPALRVNAKKQRQVVQAALSFLKQRGKFHCDCRFDVVSILITKGQVPEIEHIENAFEAT